MFEKLPLIEDFDNARTHIERAERLAAMPLSLLMTCQMTLRNRCHNRHFPAGAAYVEAICALMRAVRAKDRGLPDYMREGMAFAFDDMMRAAQGEGGAA
jgi:hypothetical protein